MIGVAASKGCCSPSSASMRLVSESDIDNHSTWLAKGSKAVEGVAMGAGSEGVVVAFVG